jgi:hypothetical protein
MIFKEKEKKNMSSYIDLEKIIEENQDDPPLIQVTNAGNILLPTMLCLILLLCFFKMCHSMREINKIQIEKSKLGDTTEPPYHTLLKEPKKRNQ